MDFFFKCFATGNVLSCINEQNIILCLIYINNAYMSTCLFKSLYKFKLWDIEAIY